MNREQWGIAYHLARLSSCMANKANAEGSAEARAYEKLHELIQSGFITRKDFNMASDCSYWHRGRARGLNWRPDKNELCKLRYERLQNSLAFNRCYES